MKKQKCVIKKKKKNQGGDVTKALKGISWFQHVKKIAFVRTFPRTLGRHRTFKTHWVAYLPGGPRTVLTGLMFFTQKPRL